jgi:transcriptional regulator with XRE-family HTH domain
VGAVPHTATLVAEPDEEVKARGRDVTSDQESVDSTGADTEPEPWIVKRLKFVRDNVHPADRKNGRYTYAEIARGTGLAQAYIGRLFAGQHTSPGGKTLTALAKFFELPMLVFLEGTDIERYFNEIRMVEALSQIGFGPVFADIVPGSPEWDQMLELFKDVLVQVQELRDARGEGVAEGDEGQRS